MRALLITVAGTSSRFGKSLGRECLKCLYNEKGFEESLLYGMARRDDTFDKYIIVGGYKFQELKKAVEENFTDIKDKTVLLYNEHYADYASGYSLYVGLKYAVEQGMDEVVFAEGDLWVDRQSFESVSRSGKDVVTFTRETIDSVKSVVFYYDVNNKVHYLYDTAHNCLEIKEAFTSIYNSGQIWKFTDAERMKRSFYEIEEEEWHGTNLVFIQKYFGGRHRSDYELKEFKTWLNCNTVEDFKKIPEVEK